MAKDAKLELSLLEMIKNSQLQNGLRHGDYRRYRQYCSRRLQRVRKSVKFTHGRGKAFLKKEITAEINIKQGHLLLPLYNAERAWSYAMELREDDKLDKEEHGDDFNSRTKFHLSARLVKAAYWSQQLLDVCVEKANARTVLEAEAYANYMKGNLTLYREDWKAALQHYSTAQKIYAELGQIGNLEQRDLLQMHLNDATPFVRYCEYNLNAMGVSSEDISSQKEKLIQLREDGGGNSFLDEKIGSLLNATAKKEAESISSIEWRNSTLPVRNNELLVALLRPKDTLKSLETTNDDQPLADEKREGFYLELFQCYDRALRLLHTEQEKYAQMKRGHLVDEQCQELDALENYIRFQKFKHMIDRNLLLYRQLVRNDATSTDLLHMLDMILQNIEQLACIPGFNDNASDVLESKAKTCTYSSLRCYYLAQTMLDSNQFVNAMALYERGLHLMEEATSLNLKRHDELDQKCLANMHDKFIGAKSRALAQSLLHESQLSSVLESVSLDTKTSKYLPSRLEKYETGPSNENFNIIDMPPRMQPVSCKPLFFDIASSHHGFPNLNHRSQTLEEQQQTQKEASKPSFLKWLTG